MKKILITLLLCLNIGTIYALTESAFITRLSKISKGEATSADFYKLYKGRTGASLRGDNAYKKKLMGFGLTENEAESFIKTGKLEVPTKPALSTSLEYTAAKDAINSNNPQTVIKAYEALQAVMGNYTGSIPQGWTEHYNQMKAQEEGKPAQETMEAVLAQAQATGRQLAQVINTIDTSLSPEQQKPVRDALLTPAGLNPQSSSSR